MRALIILPVATPSGSHSAGKVRTTKIRIGPTRPIVCQRFASEWVSGIEPWSGSSKTRTASEKAIWR